MKKNSHDSGVEFFRVDQSIKVTQRLHRFKGQWVYVFDTLEPQT